jgi:hypothetical protein
LRRVITVSLSGLDKLNSDLVKLVKVVGGVGNLVELDVEKLKVLLDRLLEFALHPPVQKA